jgi:hypothetical protein
MFQLRRTDAEFRRIMDNKSLKEFETEVLKAMTLVRSLMFAYAALSTIMDPLSGGLETAMAVGMLGMAGATSATVMSELS